MRRTLAFGIDLIPFVVVRSALLTITAEPAPVQKVLLLVSDIGFVVYRLLGARSGGRLSLGKQLLSLRIIASDGRPRLSMRTAVRREIAFVVGLLPNFYLAASMGGGEPKPEMLAILIAFLFLFLAGTWASVDIAFAYLHGGQSFHDKLAGTSVVRDRGQSGD